MVWCRAASVGTKVGNLVSELSFLSCSRGFHSVVASRGRAVGVGVELSDVSLMSACGGGLLLCGGCSVMVGAVEMLVGSGVGCDLQLVTVASRYREHVDDRYHQSICRLLEHFRGPSMNEGGVTEALSLQRPLVVASPSILAPDQAVGISHHDGGCGSRSPRVHLRSLASILCRSDHTQPFSSIYTYALAYHPHSHSRSFPISCASAAFGCWGCARVLTSPSGSRCLQLR